MIWRIFGWFTLLLLLYAGFVLCILFGDHSFQSPPAAIDWTVIPLHIAAPLWFLDRRAWIVLFAVTLIPAPIGFFRRSKQKGGRRCLLTYSITTGLACVIVPLTQIYLLRQGDIHTSASSSRTYELSDVGPYLVISGFLAFPAIVALFALQKKPRSHPPVPPPAEPGRRKDDPPGAK